MPAGLWIESRLESGHPVPEPADEEYSGRISLRMAPSFMPACPGSPDRRDISLNLLINTVLAGFAGGEDPLRSTIEELRETLDQLKAAQSQLAGIKDSVRLQPVAEGRRSRM